MFKERFKKVVVSTLALVMVVGTVAFASGVKVINIPATYGRIKIQSNGRDVTEEINTKYNSPAFVSNGRSYVPVRAIADVLGVKVDWDETTNTANFIDTKSIIMQQELNSKTKEIAELEKEIKDLKKEMEEIKEDTVSKTDLADLEKSLNKDFGDFSSLDFEITLKEKSNNNIEVLIETNLRSSREERFWSNTSSKRKEEYIEDIVKAIQKEFTKSDVEGRIYDKYNRDDLYTFNKKSNGKLNIKDKDFDTSDLEKYARIALEEDFDSIGRMTVDVKSDSYSDRNKIYSARLEFNGKNLARERDIEDIIVNIEKELQSKYDSDLEMEIEIYDTKAKEVVGEYYRGRYTESRR